ncbi:hypothetical protein [Halorussus halophilus]|uniref:hypothetical protein n=1 Tax=Halorussus halophilus TaxID=2650975 RepID=UPI0013015A31|nr:hypothetical protein [Halorussus halophilus]
MVKRRAFLLGVSGCAIGGGYYAWHQSGSGGGEMDTDGQGQGCRNGVEKRPENGTFEFVNIVQFDKVELHIEVQKDSVESIEISSNGETIHTESNVKGGDQTITFAAGDATTFDVEVLNSEGSVIDSAQFYSRCSGGTTGDNGTASSQ